MEIHLAPEIESQLQQMAISQGKALPQVVEETVERAWYLLQDQELWIAEHRADFEEDIRAGLAELERGEGIADRDLPAVLMRLKTQTK